MFVLFSKVFKKFVERANPCGVRSCESIMHLLLLAGDGNYQLLSGLQDVVPWYEDDFPLLEM